MLPILGDVDAASVITPVRVKTLTNLLAVSFLDTDGLKRVLIVGPKAFKFSRTVAGQIPTGWDAGRYGIPHDTIAQTDRTSLWALVCTAEGLKMSGITDPYELYQHMHSGVVTCLGSGMGGTVSLAKMFNLPCSFVNTTAASDWINLFLMSSTARSRYRLERGTFIISRYNAFRS